MIAAVPKKKRRAPVWLAGRSMALLRSKGYLVGKVERFIPGRKIRIDLYGIADVEAIGGGVPGVLYVQVCRAKDMGEHELKILGGELTKTHKEERRAARRRKAAIAILEHDNRIVIHGWERRGDPKRWELRTRRLGLGQVKGGARLLIWEDVRPFEAAWP